MCVIIVINFLSVCEKFFSDNSSLAKHKKIQTGEKQYASDICKKVILMERCIVTPYKDAYW